MSDKRETIKLLQPDGTIKILFRTAHESVGTKAEPQKDTIQEKPNKADNNGNNGKKPQNNQEQRFFNPLFPGHVDLFGRDLIGKNLEFTLLNETIKGKLTGYGQYDALIESQGKNFIVMKSAIVKIEVLNE